MAEFYEIYRTLINTNTSYDDVGAPHVMVTAIDHDTQKNPGLVEFDYKNVFKREDDYSDVAGFYHTHPSGANYMSQTDIDTMKQWVHCLGKSLVCLIETEEQLNGWVFAKNENIVNSHQIQAITSNDVNYDLWLDKTSGFWSPNDLLDEEDLIEQAVHEGEMIVEMHQKIKNLEKNSIEMVKRLERIDKYLYAMKEITHAKK